MFSIKLQQYYIVVVSLHELMPKILSTGATRVCQLRGDANLATINIPSISYRIAGPILP